MVEEYFHNSRIVNPVVDNVGAVPPTQVTDGHVAKLLPADIIMVTLCPALKLVAVKVRLAVKTQYWIVPLLGLMSTVTESLGV